MNILKSKSIGFYLLIALLFFQGISGLLGGASLVVDPTGEILSMPMSLLDESPFDSYLIPGMILLLVLGVFPLVVLYGLTQRKAWAWKGAILVSLALIIWIGVEITMIEYHSEPPLQLIYGSVGIVLLILTQLPVTKLILKSENLSIQDDRL